MPSESLIQEVWCGVQATVFLKTLQVILMQPELKTPDLNQWFPHLNIHWNRLGEVYKHVGSWFLSRDSNLVGLGLGC